ncbi:MAG: copper chaperone [Mycobacterium sp.]|nr:MAG: copper chaperone [Mycobacterium sp.]
MPQTRTYAVRRMACGHCARSVTAEFEALEPVIEVAVEGVPQGDSSVTVTTSADVAEYEVRDAVRRAGYEQVGEASR